MDIHPTLRLNMTGTCADPKEESARYQAAIEMAAWADAQGFGTVNLEEHHCADNGWLPSPLTMAAMVIARTRNVRVSVSALLVTLYDPLRLAEDIAVLDLASGGRTSYVTGIGYRPIEYHAMGKSWENRGAAMDEAMDAMLAAWKGEPFEFRGQTVRITPVPMTRPHPLIMIGGMSRPAARRAARLGLPFCPPVDTPELETYYYAELERQGKRGFYFTLGQNNSMLFVDEDPERAWEELAPCFLRELQEYSRWKVEGVPRPSEEEVHTIEDLRRQKRFVILHPEEAIEQIQSGAFPFTVLHPLAGGVPVDRAWQSLELFADKVLAPLRAQGEAPSESGAK